MQILEKISPDAMVFLQTHKRVWPATQRDALFWSHMRQITDKADEGAHDTWVVCNNSVDHQSFPVSTTVFKCQKTIEVTLVSLSPSLSLLITASQHWQLHPHLPDGDHGLPDVRGQAGRELGEDHARRPDVSHHLLFGGESGRLGTSWGSAGYLQARVSKVPEAVYEICD